MDEQIDMLNEDVEQFQAADYERRERIVKENLAVWENTWPQHFNQHGERDITTVCAPLGALGCSQIFLVYPTVPIQQNKASDYWKHPYSDGRRKVCTPFTH